MGFNVFNSFDDDPHRHMILFPFAEHPDILEYVRERLEVVSVVPFQEIVQFDNLKFIKQNYPPKFKECHNNALMYSLSARKFDVALVCGYAVKKNFPIPLEHSWNRVGDQYFDLTYETHSSISRTTYYKVLEFPITKHWKALNQSPMSPLFYYLNIIYPKENK